MTICPYSYADIDQMLCVDVLCCPTVIMDMSDVVTETVVLPSGSIPPLFPEAAARVRTTSTALGKDSLIHSELIFMIPCRIDSGESFVYSSVCFECFQFDIIAGTFQSRYGLQISYIGFKNSKLIPTQILAGTVVN